MKQAEAHPSNQIKQADRQVDLPAGVPVPFFPLPPPRPPRPPRPPLPRTLAAPPSPASLLDLRMHSKGVVGQGRACPTQKPHPTPPHTLPHHPTPPTAGALAWLRLRQRGAGRAPPPPCPSKNPAAPRSQHAPCCTGCRAEQCSAANIEHVQSMGGKGVPLQCTAGHLAHPPCWPRR